MPYDKNDELMYPERNWGISVSPFPEQSIILPNDSIQKGPKRPSKQEHTLQISSPEMIFQIYNKSCIGYMKSHAHM